MRLPNSIEPCPIVDALLEARFIPNVPDEAIFGILYNALAAEFPKVENLPALQLPPQIRNLNPQLRFQATYRLRSPEYVVGVGPKVISVGIVMPYPGWTEFRAKLLQVFTMVAQASVVKQLNRLGLRYVNVFGGDLTNHLTLRTTLCGEPVSGSRTLFRTILERQGKEVLLQVAKNATVKRPPDFKREGTLIDIDVSQASAMHLDLGELEKFVDAAHEAAKGLFFQLLDPDLVKELKPNYG